MNRYQFVRREAPKARTTAEIDSAAVLMNFAEAFEASKGRGEFEYLKEHELTKQATEQFRKADAIEISLDELPNGAQVNRFKAKFGKNSVSGRIYGIGKGLTTKPRTLTADEIKAVNVGVCESDGEIVSEAKTNTATGEIQKIPVWYLNLA